MGLRYDDIKKGRRWDWDKLQDPEEQRRREQERREQDPEYKKTRSLLKQIEERRKNELVEGREDWVKLKHKLRWRLGITAAVLIGLMIWQLVQVFDYRRTVQDKLKDSDLIVAQRIAYSEYGDPADAYTSWRSAWARNDLQAVIRSDSVTRLRRLYGESNISSRLADMHKRGLTMETQRVALNFGNPEVIRLPERPYIGQELAVYKSGRIVLRSRQAPGSNRRSEITRDRWVAAFAWDSDLREWRLEELRTEDYWDDSWRFATQILTPTDYVRRKRERRAEEKE